MVEREDGCYLELNAADGEPPECPPAGTAMLGETAVSKLPYLDYDGGELAFVEDFFGAKRESGNCLPGPFAAVPEPGKAIRVFRREPPVK